MEWRSASPMKISSRISPPAIHPANPSESNRARLQRILREMLADKSRVRRAARTASQQKTR
jgi:hypothetical protein